jgi:large subunit ribosomal protein L21
MYAIVEVNGVQLKVEQNQIIKVPFMQKMAEGSEVEFDNVLMLKSENETIIGTPTIKNARVKAEVLAHEKDKKITIFKKKRRKGYEKKQGHRQNFTKVKIMEISS